MSNSAVFGIFSAKPQVEIAVDEMKGEGFRNSDISVLFPYDEGTKGFAIENGTKNPDDVAATPGVVIGPCEFVRIDHFRQIRSDTTGALGWLAGIGVLAIPGLGPFVAAGPIMTLLGDLEEGGAGRSMTGALIGMGIPECVATGYEGRIKSGCILLSVHTDDARSIRRAKKILEQAGADNIASAGETNGDER